MVDEGLRALRVTPHGVITDVWLPRDTTAQLAAMYEQMGCALVEPVRLGDDLTMWCDEEGFLASRPEANSCATGIAARRGVSGQPFVGTVLFTGDATEDGTTQELSARQAIGLRRECEHVVRFAVIARIADPRRTPLDEVHDVQHECAPDAGIGSR